MGRERNWTPEEHEYLCENWGSVSMPAICKRLDRSRNAILNKIHRLELGAFLEAGEYISFNQLMKALGRGIASAYTQISWVENRGFPIKYKKVADCSFRIVYLKDFWKWAEQNRTFIDFSKVEKNILGEEPGWVGEQRKYDVLKKVQFKLSPWTPAEDKLLVDLLKQQRYGYQELSQRLARTCGAIQRRVLDLKTPYRPVKADNHVNWTDDEFRQLAKMIKSGCNYEIMSDQLGRSSKALRGKVYAVYRTENLDIVMSMVGAGAWGDGAPVLTVKDRKRTMSVKDPMQHLAELLLTRRNQLAYNGFWQKDLCMSWHPVKGCTSCESDCDSCSSFRRIKDQYCRRCGATIISREETNMCDRCKTARKKQAQKKWAILNN